jgi:hypothetical protein
VDYGSIGVSASSSSNMVSGYIAPTETFSNPNSSGGFGFAEAFYQDTIIPTFSGTAKISIDIENGFVFNSITAEACSDFGDHISATFSTRAGSITSTTYACSSTGEQDMLVQVTAGIPPPSRTRW